MVCELRVTERSGTLCVCVCVYEREREKEREREREKKRGEQGARYGIVRPS